MKQATSITKKSNKLNNRPSISQPEVIKTLVKVNKQAKKLHDLTTHDKIAELLGTTRQAVSYHANKEDK